MSQRARSLGYLALSALLWSGAGLLIKSVDWDALSIASTRSLFAALALLVLTVSRSRSLLPRLPTRPEAAAALFLALLSISFVAANKLTNAATAILLQYTAPVWVAMLAPLLLRERTNGLDWLFIALTFGGMGLFFLDSLSVRGLAGIGAAMFSGLCYAGLAIALRRGGAGLGMLYGNILLCLSGLFVWGPPWPPARDIALLALAGVFMFALPYHLFSLAGRGASALEMVLVTSLEPVLNPIWVFLVLGERPGPWALIGGAAVFACITLWSALKALGSRRAPAAPQETPPGKPPASPRQARR